MKQKRKIGKTQKKILTALLGGVGLGFSRTPRQYFRVLREISKEWKRIDQQNFTRSFERLSREKLVREQRLADGSFRLVLTKEGEKIASILDIRDNCIHLKKPKRWDGKWRVVLFDIPEKDRLFRDILREHLYTLDFYKLQHSVFVSPYPHEEPILKLIKIYSAEKYVRVMTVLQIDNEQQLKKHFSIR